MRVYVCKGNDGKPFIASEGLACVLDWANAARLAANNGCVKVNVVEADGALVGTAGEFRVIAYAEGGYEVFWRHEPHGWLITDTMPADVEETICLALGIVPVRDWTAEEILVREG